jgi:hypothetical protein
MAIINCPECNKEISDRASACPNCAFPIGNSTQPEVLEGIDVLPQMEKKKPNVFIQIFMGLFVFGVVYYGLIWFSAGKDAANTTIATVLKQPVELTNETLNLRASSAKGIPVSLPYSGKLNVWVTVEDGNKISVFLVDKSNADNAVNGKAFKYLSNFIGEKTKKFHANDLLSEGLYYIVIRDETLGLLSKKTSRINVRALLKP